MHASEAVNGVMLLCTGASMIVSLGNVPAFFKILNAKFYEATVAYYCLLFSYSAHLSYVCIR